MRLSYCVVNTSGREMLLSCLKAIERTAPPGVSSEVLVLDNASDDGSVDAVRALGGEIRLIALDRRAGKAENDSTLLREAKGEYCLLLNEDSELADGASAALVEALDANPGAAVAGARLLDSDGRPVPCAWRFPGLGTALAGAFFLHRWLVEQSGGDNTRSVGWVQSSAMLVRRSAAQRVGYLDPDFFVYADETDFERRLRDAGFDILFVPAARAVHHDQLATDSEGRERRLVEFHRNRDLYLRKHRGRLVAALVRPIYAFTYLAYAGLAVLLPGRHPHHLLAHARQALRPGRGEGIREAAEAYNRSSSRISASTASGTSPAP